MRYNLLALILTVAGCGTVSAPVDGTRGDCDGCDTPHAASQADAELLCRDRRSSALSSNQAAYAPNFIRWSCADVSGVNDNGHDDRGQEYCEYFAVVKPPGVDHSIVVGRDGGTGLTLTADQKDQLDALGAGEVGRCVFTSWQRDVVGPVPACRDAATCPKVLDEPVSEDVFKMHNGFNSLGAAEDLLVRCLTGSPPGGIGDAYTAGCMLDYNLFGTEWRKSDPTICAAAQRLTSCGCNTAATASLSGDERARALANAVVPPPPADPTQVTMRAFPLGTWSGGDQLPAGCEYVDVGVEANGQPSRAIVSCKLTADDVLNHAGDLKEQCRTKYGDNVVVYIPLPADAISCTSCNGSWVMQ